MFFLKQQKPSTYTLTIDVEIDAGPKWKTSSPQSFLGVIEGIPKLQILCDRYGVKPTYLISPATMFDEDCIKLFKSLDQNKCELGTHLHGEYIGPHAKYLAPDFSGKDPGEMQCEYAKELEFEKLKTLTEKFIAVFNRSPKSFRAGRFGARGHTIKCLEELEYTHDTSVTPFKNWYKKADFSQIESVRPYHPSFDDITKKGNSKIVEVPVSITPNLEWLRPTPGFSNFRKTKKVLSWYQKQSETPVYCSMFHNVELIPGKSPYCPSSKECDFILKTLEKTFKYLKKNNCTFKTISEIEV